MLNGSDDKGVEFNELWVTAEGIGMVGGSMDGARTLDSIPNHRQLGLLCH